jgi:cobalt-zinc-cadmium efflux system membrane fusion protein
METSRECAPMTRLPPRRFARWLGATTALVFLGCSRPKPETTEALPSSSARAFHLPDAQLERIKITTVGRGTLKRSVDTTGIVDFDQNASTHIVSAISGTVSEILVPLGANVAAGAPLAKIASPDFAGQVSAYRKAAILSANLRRIADVDRELVGAGNIGRRELEQAEADAVSAEADREAASAQLRALGIPPAELSSILDGRAPVDALATLHSPMAGTVVEQLLNPGQLLEAGATPCFTIAKLDEMWVKASVFESDLRRIQIGAKVDVGAATAEAPFEGRVDYVGDLVDPETRAVSVRVVVKNRDHLLKKDAYVSVHVQSTEESAALLLPASAILLDADNLPFVFVENADHEFLRRRVTTGARSGGEGESLEVTSGLEPGEQVVRDGGLFIQFAEDQ